MKEAHKTVTAYLKACTKDHRLELEKLRKLIHSVAKDVTEEICYGIPTFRLNGKPLAHIGTAKEHVALYPTPAVIQEFAEELKKFDCSKGTVRFTPEKPIPVTLVRKMLRSRMKLLKPVVPKKDKK